MTENIAAQSRPANPLLFIVWHFFRAALIAALLLGLGGRDWQAARVYCAIVLVAPFAINYVLYVHQPDLFRKRLGEPVHLLQTLLILLWAPVVVFGRADWAPIWLGAAVLIAGYALAGAALLTNPWAIENSELQDGQQLVNTGPYRFVRHPLYLGNCFLGLGAALLLGWGAGLMCVPMVMANFFRAQQEDEMLRKGLPGYSLYMLRVRRMIV